MRTKNLDKTITTDWLIEVRKGNVPGHSLQHITARNIDIDTVEEHVWYNGGDLTWLTVASQMDIVSTDANDTSAGTGARKIRIYGLDSNFDTVIVDYLMNGLTIVTTTESFIRINFIEVIENGTYGGSNLGDITLRVTGGGSIQASIQIGFGKTQKSQYTVKTGCTAFLLELELAPEGNKTLTFKLKKREGADVVAAPFNPVIIDHSWDGIDKFLSTQFLAQQTYSEKTDIWITAQGTANNNIVGVDYTLLIIDNNYLP